MTSSVNRKAKIGVKDINLGQVSFHSINYNTNHIQCLNHRPTSASVKCELPAELTNIDIIRNISFPLSNMNFNQFSSVDIAFAINKECRVSVNTWPTFVTDSGKRSDKVVSLEGLGEFELNQNTIADFSLSSKKAYNKNSLEATIPPSSCFNMTMKESISVLTVGYGAKAVVKVYEDDIQLFGINLQNRVTGINPSFQIDNNIALLDISGEITFNVLNTDYGDVIPCGG